MNSLSDKSIIRRKLYSIIIKELKNKLTIGRIEDGFTPYGYSSSTRFIIHCNDAIKKTVDDIIDTYGNITNLEHDMILDFLYENIDLPLM